MTYQQFQDSLVEQHPPQLPVLLESLWHDANGNWHKAHELIQDLETKEAAHIHAYLHRKEGDDGNASYWYHRAGEKKPSVSLMEEWKELARKFTNEK
jgi:hypothetical protein